MTSPFLAAPPERWIASHDLAFTLCDGFPASPGHTPVIPKRLVATWFEATRVDQLAILELLDEVKAHLDAELQPDGYTIGISAGVAAGQTVMHLRVHVIPLYSGDVEDPHGGVRHVMRGAMGNRSGGIAPRPTGPNRVVESARPPGLLTAVFPNDCCGSVPKGHLDPSART